MMFTDVYASNAYIPANLVCVCAYMHACVCVTCERVSLWATFMIGQFP